jgi:hypothetical protein
LDTQYDLDALMGFGRHFSDENVELVLIPFQRMQSWTEISVTVEETVNVVPS